MISYRELRKLENEVTAVLEVVYSVEDALQTIARDAAVVIERLARLTVGCAMNEPTNDDIDAAERTRLHSVVLARAVRRIVGHALPDDNSDTGEDRVSASELLAMIEKESGEALERL